MITTQTATTTNQVLTVYWLTKYMNGAKVSVYINVTILWDWIILVRCKKIMNKWKTSKTVGFHPAKNHPMVPPLNRFQGKNKNCSSLARTISASRRSFFANLTPFERHSGLKKFSLLKIAILKMGWLSKFQSLRSWGGAQQKLYWPNTYKFGLSPQSITMFGVAVVLIFACELGRALT